MNKTKKSMILLSICIPTYNRSKLLKQCLLSLLTQFKKKSMYQSVEIIISNNDSEDNTEDIIIEFQKKFSNIRYFKNKKNIGTKNTMKVATYAKGEYIWFFSDDDWHKPDSILEVVKVLKKYRPDFLICNVDLYSKDGKKLIDPNLLRTKKNTFANGKKDFFSFLESKFFLPIDWFLTCYSNKIIKRSLFQKNKSILTQYKGKHFVFPHMYFIFFGTRDYSIFTLAKSMICYREGNLSFGSVDKKEFLNDWYKTLKIHYNLISKINKKYISIKFSLLMVVKLYLRDVRLFFLNLFGYDISIILMKLFYK